MTLIKSAVLASMLAVSGVAASAGGLSAPAGDSVIPQPPAPARQGSLGGVLPIVGIVGLLLLMGQNNSSGT